MLTLLPTLLLALTTPPPPGSSSRRAALQGIASATLLGSTTIPGAAMAKKGGEDVLAGFGQTGALRSDVPESLTGSGVEITITDITYKELEACPKKFFLPPKGGPWNCIEITAKAYNQGKREVGAADVFGQLYDAEGFSPAAVSLDPSQKAPLTTLRTTFPKGKPVEVTWVQAVQARSPRPFRFAGMKAEYRNAAMAKTYKSFDPCEIDSSACEEDEDQPDNAMALRTGQGFTYKK